MELTPEQARIVAALREESKALAAINLAIIHLGGEPIPPRPEYLRLARTRRGAEEADTPSGTSRGLMRIR